MYELLLQGWEILLEYKYFVLITLFVLYLIYTFERIKQSLDDINRYQHNIHYYSSLARENLRAFNKLDNTMEQLSVAFSTFSEMLNKRIERRTANHK